MKDSKNQEVEFQMVIRPIPGMLAYSVILGEIVNGQFQPTDRRPANFVSDFTCVKKNPLAPDQRYVSADDLVEIVGSLGLGWDSCMIVSGFLVFSVKDIPYEKSTEEDEE